MVALVAAQVELAADRIVEVDVTRGAALGARGSGEDLILLGLPTGGLLGLALVAAEELGPLRPKGAGYALVVSGSEVVPLVVAVGLVFVDPHELRGCSGLFDGLGAAGVENAVQPDNVVGVINRIG